MELHKDAGNGGSDANLTGSGPGVTVEESSGGAIAGKRTAAGARRAAASFVAMRQSLLGNSVEMSSNDAVLDNVSFLTVCEVLPAVFRSGGGAKGEPV